MRVGDVDLDCKYRRTVWVCLLVVAATLGLLVSLSAAVLFFTTFCFGAGLLSIALDLSNGHQLPNLLSALKTPTLLKRRTCSSCNRNNCSSHLHGEPWADLFIPVEIDAALENLLERIVREHVYSWYREVSYDEEFVQDVRHLIRYATAMLVKRAHRIDVPLLIVKRAIAMGVTHVDALIRADAAAHGKEAAELREAFVDCMGPSLHPAAFSRSREVEYVRSVSSRLIPFLVPVRFQSSRSMLSLMSDLLSGAVLQPLLDLLPNPDSTINLLIGLGFSPQPSLRFERASGREVKYLEHFFQVHDTPTQSALRMDLSAILKDHCALFAFMQFLKEESALNQLQFCLSVEDFNKRIMKELTDEETKALHQEALDLYTAYFRTDSRHRVNVSPSIALDIFTILSGPPEHVVQLRTTTPLFRAYEEVYSNLETKMCPGFYKSEEYYRFLLGNKEKEAVEDSSKQAKDSSKKFGRSLSKFKHGVLGKSMEGILVEAVVPPADPAFDLADICDDPDDEISLLSQSGGGIDSDFRDLSAWRVSIPRLTTTTSVSGRSCFVFVLEVQRIDVQSRKDDGEDLRWCVERKYGEFYALESKLTEFHGDFDDVKLPPRSSKLFSSRGLDSLQSKMKPFEEYLTGLLKKPSLRGSALLHAFLTSREEFIVAASDLGLGKIIKNVPMKLLTAREKGQSLQVFIDAFLASTQSRPPKPRIDSVIGATAEPDATAERTVRVHPLFGDCFAIRDETKVAKPFSPPPSDHRHGSPAPEIATVFDALVYLASNLFNAPLSTVRLMLAFGVVARNTLEHLTLFAISTKLSKLLCTNRLAFLCRLTEEAMFGSSRPRTDEDKLRRKEEALGNFQRFVRPLLQPLVGNEEFEKGTKFVFDGLQDPVINKHLAIQLFDLVLLELFPEIGDRT